MLLLFFREESILLRADETPADGGFVNRSFFRGMDVTILAQKTVLYCAYATRHPWCPALQQYPLPSTHSAGPGLQGTTRDPASNSNSPGHRPAGHRLWPLRGSHLGTAPHPRPWGPRGEDQPLVDTAVREIPDTGSCYRSIIAAGPPPPTLFLKTKRRRRGRNEKKRGEILCSH